MNKVVLVGCGYWGKNWYSTLSQIDNVRVVSVIDPNPVIPVLGQVNSLEEFHEKDYDYDYVIIATQAEYHKAYFDYFKDKIPSKNILIEKPCGTLEHREELEGCFPGYLFLSSPQYKIIKSMLYNKTLGDRILYSNFRRASMGPRIRTDVSIIEDYMIHDLYLYCALFEPTESKVSGVLMNNFISPVQEDTAFVTSKNLNQVTTFFSSWNYPHKERLIEIIGNRGSVIWKDDKVTFTAAYYTKIDGFDKHRNKGYELRGKKAIDVTPKIIKSNIELQFEDFVKGVDRSKIYINTNNLIFNIKKNLVY
jgi:predicted dehydrogenase